MDTKDADIPLAAPVDKDDVESKPNPQNVPSSVKTAEGDKENTKLEIKAADGSKPTIWIQEPGKENGEEERSVQSDSYSRAAEINPSHTMTVVHSRRNANGTIGSVYSGNKIRHLKKEDGVPLWREDIQYSFLRDVFENTVPVFTDEQDSSKNYSFADIYIRAMARSTKTSKVLREKLMADRDSALNMAMICLLVNVGRMNTTLNFFPEMRAQLRTYHSIPCLQHQQDQNAQYKGLQDAPRLKSILKGSCEDPNQPSTIEQIQNAKVPRTNPVNLIFVMSQYAPKVSETHFVQPRDFFDLVIRKTWSSNSRAVAFLWLMWWYLESDFSDKDALENPFGPGTKKETDSRPLKVPDFEGLTEEQASAENVDTEEEKLYGEKMAVVRKKILEEDETVGPPLKKPAARLGDSLDDRVGASPARSDMDRTRSPSPTTLPPLKMPKPRRIASARDQDLAGSDMEGRPAQRIVLKTSKIDRVVGSSSPAPGGMSANLGPHGRRSRPETSHQRAVNLNRKMRIESILHKKLVKVQNEIRRTRRREGPTQSYVVMKRVMELPPNYDSEEESSWGSGGIVPNPKEMHDFGGEAMLNRKVLDRACRRLGREEISKDPYGDFTREYNILLQKKRDLQMEVSNILEDRYRRPMGTGRRRGGGARRSQAQRELAAAPQDADRAEDQINDVEMMDLGGDGGGADDDSGDDSAGVDDSDPGDDATEDGMME